tara:strand:- start:94 stop:387 length:294 start_codon:yes stop_codon:yes gene_type:complete
MNQAALRMAHFTVLNRAKSHSLNGIIPKVLPSLEKTNPSEEEIRNDYMMLTKHFKHPVFQNFAPTYYEMIDCPETAWRKRLDKSSKELMAMYNIQFN